MQADIDERADERQRHALTPILRGGETAEAKTHWWICRAMSCTSWAIMAALRGAVRLIWPVSAEMAWAKPENLNRFVPA